MFSTAQGSLLLIWTRPASSRVIPRTEMVSFGHRWTQRGGGANTPPLRWVFSPPVRSVGFTAKAKAEDRSLPGGAFGAAWASMLLSQHCSPSPCPGPPTRPPRMVVQSQETKRKGHRSKAPACTSPWGFTAQEAVGQICERGSFATVPLDSLWLGFWGPGLWLGEGYEDFLVRRERSQGGLSVYTGSIGCRMFRP